MTNSQQSKLNLIISTLTGNYMPASMFVSAEVQGDPDPYTASILVKLSFEEHECFIWIRTHGKVTDINGNNLMKKGRFVRLPNFRDITV